jgi:glycosyltransferase involved in cell wall biosynthesis
MAKVLIIIPYKFYPPLNGGGLRCFYILKELSLTNDIYLLTNQEENDFSIVNQPSFPANIHVVSVSNKNKVKTIFNALFSEKIADALNTRFLLKSFTAKANELFLNFYSVIKKLNQKVEFDVVLYENLESLSLLRSSFNNNKIKHVLDAHNIDSELWMMLYHSGGQFYHKTYAQNATNIEKNLFRIIDSFLCCSEIDKEKLLTINKNKIDGVVIPNGVDCSLKPFDQNDFKFQSNNILFCGSLDYKPNIDGLKWFHEKVFPLLLKLKPDLRLTVIGKGGDINIYRFLVEDEHVDFIGEVESTQEYYYDASVSIVPLHHGSGTRLKIFEAMSFGVPVVSTTTGAEGIEYQNEFHLLIADHPEAFAQKIFSLFENTALFNNIRKNANELVNQKYDWSKIGKTLRNKFEDLLIDNEIK